MADKTSKPTPKPSASTTPKPKPSPSSGPTGVNNSGPTTSGAYGSTGGGAFTTTTNNNSTNAATAVVTDPNTGQSVAGATMVPIKKNGKVVPTSISELVLGAKNAKNLAAIRNTMISNGLLPKGTKSLTTVQNAWTNILVNSAISGTDPYDYMAQLKSGGFGVDVNTGSITPLQSSIRQTSKEDAKAKIVESFKSLLNREPTAAEVAAATTALNNDEKKNPTKTVTTRDAKGNISYSTTGGTNIDQFLSDYINSKFGEEATAVKTQSPDVTQTLKDKATYDKAIEAAKGDLEKIKAAKENTTYGRNLTELETQINDLAMTSGATTDPGKVAEIAKYLASKGLDLRSETGKSYVEAQLQFGKNPVTVGGKTTDMYTGKAGSNVDTLNKVALANGLTLDKVFDPSALPEVLSAIAKGEDINTYAKIIRDAAKVAWNVSDNVGKLMDQGISLDAIYSPYKNTLASTLELDPNSVTLNDLAKFGIVGQPSPGTQAPQNLYDFQKALRKDNRWQYTQEAHQEVSNGVQKVLQDFGFMG